MSAGKDNTNLYLGLLILIILAYLYHKGFFDDKKEINKNPPATPATQEPVVLHRMPKFFKGTGVIESSLYNNTCPTDYNNNGINCVRAFPPSIIPFEKKIKSQDQLLYDKSQGSTIPDPGLGSREWNKQGLFYYPKCPSDTIDNVINCLYT